MPKMKELVVCDKEEDDVLDDWQAVADALVDNSHNHQDFVPGEPPVASVACVEPAHAATNQSRPREELGAQMMILVQTLCLVSRSRSASQLAWGNTLDFYGRCQRKASSLRAKTEASSVLDKFQQEVNEYRGY